jgi:hypothetical protein
MLNSFLDSRGLEVLQQQHGYSVQLTCFTDNTIIHLQNYLSTHVYKLTLSNIIYNL